MAVAFTQQYRIRALEGLQPLSWIANTSRSWDVRTPLLLLQSHVRKQGCIRAINRYTPVMAKQKKYWLMKSEPDAYSIDDLERDGVEPWDGIRNYQARNFLRDTMQIGDRALFYHSNATPPGVVGEMEVISEPEPDELAFDPKSKYYDPKSDPEDPRWVQRQMKFVKKFKRMIPLAELKEDPELEGLLVTKRGQRLSIQPVEKEHFLHIRKLGSRSS